jgi:hypothetical protein
MRFIADVVSENSQVVLAGVKGEYEHKMANSGLIRGQGHIELSAGQHLGPGLYELLLDDGGKAPIRVTAGNHGPARQARIKFKLNCLDW